MQNKELNEIIEAHPNEESEDPDDEKNELNTPTALVIEDVEENIRPLRTFLTSMNFNLHTAASVNEAVAKYKELESQFITIDVVYLDLLLAENSTGPQFLKIAKESGWLQNTYIFLMSGTRDEKILSECYQYYDGLDFVPKPIMKPDLKIHESKITKFLEDNKCPVDGYKIVKTLGKGAYGLVYLVLNISQKRYYAMKEIQRSVGSVSKEAQMLEGNETSYLKNLIMPTIIALNDSEVINGREYLILEYAKFGSLDDRIDQYKQNNKNFETKEILDWMTEIFIGLYYIHKKGIMHRDIKTKNILLCEGNIAKISDLGLARIATNAETDAGAPLYKAPEIISFQGYTNKIDIWGAGNILYKLITLKDPFYSEDNEKVKEKIKKIEYDPVPENTNNNLKILLNLTFAKKEDRASAAQILSLNFIRDRINYLYKSGVLDLEPSLYNEMISLKSMEINQSFKKNNENNSFKEIDYYKCFRNAQIIYYKYPRISLYSNFYLDSVQVISEYSLLNPEEGCKISKEDITDLKILGILVPYNQDQNIENKLLKSKKSKWRNEKEKYYTVVKSKIPGIDNSLNLPLNDDDFYDCFYLDPLMTSKEVLEKSKQSFVYFRRILEEEDMGDEDKFNASVSKETYEFLISCKKLQNINLSKCENDDKTCIMLNIYQTMLYHYIIKCVMFDYELNEKLNLSFFQSILASFKIGKFANTIRYKIGGQILSIDDMKHIVIRRNTRIPYHIFRPVYNDDDPRIKFIGYNNFYDLSLEEKIGILAICQDPPDILDNDSPDIIEPAGIAFDPVSLNTGLETNLKYFVQDNIWVDETCIHVPKFIYKYMNDLGGNEKEIIEFLLSILYHEPFFKKKLNLIKNKLSSNKININYYDIFRKYN